MLILYRRHLKLCPHQREGRKHLRCLCPVWVDGRLNGKRIHRSLGTTDWQKAQQIVREWEANGTSSPPKVRLCSVSPEDAWRRFLADLEARNLCASTIRKYRLLSRQMNELCCERKIQFLNQLDLATLSEFRSGWRVSPLTSLKKLERLRAFFNFGQANGWINDNPARRLKAPRVLHRPTLPFTQEEMAKILDAFGPYVSRTAPRGRDNALRLKALVLLLRYSGMRIGDAVKLTTDRISGRKLFLYTQKTGVPVYSILPEFVAGALNSLSPVKDVHLFWSGKGDLETIVGSWRKRLAKLFRMAKIENGPHPHRFRDTFAAELLQAGVPLERVSILLGHQSTKITEKYYAAWTQARQLQVEKDLERAWSLDPIVILESKVTRQLRGETEIVN
jgi:integrase/recombinase XerD